MYQLTSLRAISPFRRRGARPPVAPTVILLGVVSMLTDISSEMVSSILPLYVVIGLGLSPAAFGAIDGIYQGSSAIVRILSGVISDRSTRHKEVALTGYGLSALSKLGLLLAGSSAALVGAIIFADRTGKGIRTAPRDALISLSTPPEHLGAAFGVHRAMDTLGAMIGPLVAFGILWLAPGRYDSVIFVSLCIAVIGVAVLALFVRNQERVSDTDERASLAGSMRLLRMRSFRRVVIVGSVLALLTISDAFIYLGLQRRLDFDPRLIPLLFVGTASSYMLLAAPIGRLADRVGRWRILIAGHVVLLGAYAVLGLAEGGQVALVACLLLLGTFYACTDGVLMALAAPMVPAAQRATGLAVVMTATSIAKLLASVLFGGLWALLGLQTAVGVFAVGLVIGIVALAIVLGSGRREQQTGARP